jgi:uncharacterized membrane protein YbhN (UPF0104 family)
VNHVLALGLLALDTIFRAWRIQLAVAVAGAKLNFQDAFRLNLYGEAAAALTPNRLGGEPARFVGLTESGLRPVAAMVAIGVEVASEWPVFGVVATWMLLHYVPDWRFQAGVWLRHHRAGELVTIELAALAVLIVIYLLQRLTRAGRVRHRVRRQWRVAWAHVRRGPRWMLLVGAVLTALSVAARALILPALALGDPGEPGFQRMFFGALVLIHAPLVLPLPAGGGGIEVAFLSGFAGDFGSRQVWMLVAWRFYTSFVLTAVGVYAMIRSLGLVAARKLVTFGWFKGRKKRIMS